MYSIYILSNIYNTCQDVTWCQLCNYYIFEKNYTYSTKN